MGKIIKFIRKLWELSPKKAYLFLIKRILPTNSNEKKLYEIKKLPRFEIGETNILDKKIQFIDNASFLFMYNEIFETQIYKFFTDNNKPYIIDCGANIGLSIIYFKKIYPNARITAFEPEPNIFNVLKENIESFNFSDVQLVRKGISDNDGQSDFLLDGADGGRIVRNMNDVKNITKIETTRLKDFLIQPVDFLKIDIEGSETEVILDCEDLLNNVKNIFVEYHSFINKKQTIHLLVNSLARSGFRLHIHFPGVYSHQPFIRINTSSNDIDMQLNIFGFRE